MSQDRLKGLKKPAAAMRCPNSEDDCLKVRVLSNVLVCVHERVWQCVGLLTAFTETGLMTQLCREDDYNASRDIISGPVSAHYRSLRSALFHDWRPFLRMLSSSKNSPARASSAHSQASTSKPPSKKL